MTTQLIQVLWAHRVKLDKHHVTTCGSARCSSCGGFSVSTLNSLNVWQCVICVHRLIIVFINILNEGSGFKLPSCCRGRCCELSKIPWSLRANSLRAIFNPDLNFDSSITDMSRTLSLLFLSDTKCVSISPDLWLHLCAWTTSLMSVPV